MLISLKAWGCSYHQKHGDVHITKIMGMLISPKTWDAEVNFRFHCHPLSCLSISSLLPRYKTTFHTFFPSFLCNSATPLSFVPTLSTYPNTLLSIFPSTCLPKQVVALPKLMAHLLSPRPLQPKSPRQRRRTRSLFLHSHPPKPDSWLFPLIGQMPPR